MTTSTPFTTPANTLASQHGNLSSRTSSRSMAFNPHESHPLEREQEQDAMDTSLDFTPDNSERTEKQADQPCDTEALGLKNAESVLEQPREGQSHSVPLVQKAAVSFQPYLTQDLLALCGLQPLAASVARIDPATGEKINKMRKSYEGKVKALGLAGRNRAVKHEAGKSPGLLELARWPEEEWYNQKVLGKDVQKGLPSATLAKLEKAMQMQPGPLPNNAEWEDLLGYEKAKPITAVVDQKAKKQTHAEVPALKANGLSNGASVNAAKSTASELIRPKRTGKKRRYDEHSFEGYGEGYVDDDGDVLLGGGYTSEEGSRISSTSKKRKKDYASSNPTGLGERKGSYGVGMIGVGSGIGAYGR